MRETGENFRAIQVDLIERISAERGLVDAPMTAPALSALLSALARAMLIEGNVGMEEGMKACAPSSRRPSRYTNLTDRIGDGAARRLFSRTAERWCASRQMQAPSRRTRHT
ncbi:hypothetical protein ACFSHP_02180 [Novosphingobium panipatense]